MLLSSGFHQRFRTNQQQKSSKVMNDGCTTPTTISSNSSLSLRSIEDEDHSGFLLDPLLLLEEGTSSTNRPKILETTDVSSAKQTWGDLLLEPTTSKGRFSVPLQSASRPSLKYLILVPLASFVSMIIFAYFWIPLLNRHGVFMYLDNSFHQLEPRVLLFLGLPVLFGLVYDLAMEATTYAMLLRGRQRRHLPDHMSRLTHAVIVCNYKEPLEVLRATVKSLANNTLAKSTMIVLACEERDPTASAVYHALEDEFAVHFRAFLKTTHVLKEGEIIGKSSNENHACRELFKVVREEGLDPFQVMVTTCDADSLFDSVFLEQVEAEFCRVPDGRRFLYNSPINTYRNLPECNALVRSFEVLRCQFDTFNGMTGFRPAQSNYSLTLGFAHEINYWDPSNTSEDFHTTLKAMAMTGLGSSSVVVKVWSLILNDSVTGFQDRWVQAKRHMWGVEEVAFVTSLFPVIRLNLWLTLLGRVSSQMFGVCTPAMLYLCFQPIREVFLSLHWQTKYWIISMYMAASFYSWTKMVVREIFLYRNILSNRDLMMKRSMGEWFQLVVGWPILSQLAFILFATTATWRMLIHAIFHDTLAYVTAPKTLNASSTNGGAKPKKGM